MNNNSAKAYLRETEEKQQQDNIIAVREQKEDTYNDDMQFIAKETLNVAKQNQRTTKNTFWVAIISGIIGLITLIFK